jgi:hypothetical protein
LAEGLKGFAETYLWFPLTPSGHASILSLTS